MADSLAQTQVQTCASGCKIEEVLRADLTEMSLAHSKQSFRVCVHSFSVRLPKMTDCVFISQYTGFKSSADPIIL